MKARRLEVFAGLIPGDSVAASGSPVTHRLGFSWENWANVPAPANWGILRFCHHGESAKILEAWILAF
jgi:hypothetical protein